MAAQPSDLITPVILSGGAGTRLWPLSSADRPKQLLRLLGPDTLLELTARRVSDPGLFTPPTIVANAAHAVAIREQLAGSGTEARLILEPAARNTAPAIALAALAADPDDLLLVLPSDHMIADPEAFHGLVGSARALAAQDWIVTFGIRASRPETGFGYISRGEGLGGGAFKVERFVEKPDLKTAEAYCAAGTYDWNGGIFLFRAGRMIEALRLHAPAILDAAERALREADRSDDTIVPDLGSFARSPAQSIDYAVMEHDGRIAVLPADIGWSDVGSWHALHELSAKDAEGSTIEGNAIAIDTRNCLIRSDGPMIAAIGTQGLAIVASADAVLVVPLELAQRVGEIVKALGKDAAGN
jgi:mannose-1-phosphate guanylyltransferase/mannose-1-phosphate guanylyltransferase/mannose-6-phosphate isomerase